MKINNEIINCEEFVREMKSLKQTHRKEMLESKIYKKYSLILADVKYIQTKINKIER